MSWYAFSKQKRSKVVREVVAVVGPEIIGLYMSVPTVRRTELQATVPPQYTQLAMTPDIPL